MIFKTVVLNRKEKEDKHRCQSRLWVVSNPFARIGFDLLLLDLDEARTYTNIEDEYLLKYKMKSKNACMLYSESHVKTIMKYIYGESHV